MSSLIDQLSFVGRNLPVLLEGALVTVQLTVAMLALGFAVGVPLALLEVYGPRILRYGFVLPTVTFFRGVPTLVLLFLVYFGAPLLAIDMSSFMAAVLAIGLRSGIYQSQLFRGAILAVSEGQMLAARAIGMSKWQAIWSIVLPQAFRTAIPSFTNEYAVVLKESSLAYALGVTELMRQGRYIVARTFQNSLTVYLTCAAIYFVLVYGVSRLLQRLETKLAIPGFENVGSRRLPTREER